MSRVVSFHGGCHGAGTSMLAVCAAEHIASSFAGIRVMIIFAQSPGSPEYVRGGLALRSIAPHILKRNPDVDEIVERSKISAGFHAIGAGEGPADFSDMHPDDGSFLAEALSPRFDLIVCDCGCEPDRGLSLGLMFAADDRISVALQRESCLRRMEQFSPVYARLGISADVLAVNRFGSGAAYTPGYMARRLAAGDADILTVRESSAASSAEAEQLPLLRFRDGGFRKDIALLCGRIAERL